MDETELVLASINRQINRPNLERAVELRFVSYVQLPPKMSNRPVELQVAVGPNILPQIPPEEWRVILYLTGDEWEKAKMTYFVGDTYKLKVEKDGKITIS